MVKFRKKKRATGNVRIPFGKTHKDELISNCPTWYLDWLIGEDWVGEPLKSQIIAHLETRSDWKRM